MAKVLNTEVIIVGDWPTGLSCQPLKTRQRRVNGKEAHKTS